MGDSMMKCKRARVLKTRTMEVTSSSLSSKRRKIASDDIQLQNHHCDVNSSPENSMSPAISENSDHGPTSQSSSKESSESVEDNLRSVDLKERKSSNTENSTSNEDRFSRETTPTSEICGEETSEELESTTFKSPQANLRRKMPAVSLPSSEELEEFFSVAEKYEQKRFADKYNFDVVNGEPLEGRYQWVRLNP